MHPNSPQTAQAVWSNTPRIETCARCKGPIKLGELFHQVRRMTDDYQGDPEFWTGGKDLYIAVHANPCPPQPTVFPPGWILREELRARGITQSDLAKQLDRPLSMVKEIINARKAITPETAIGLEQALGVSAEFWVRLEGAYRLNLARGEKPLIAKLKSTEPPSAQRDSAYIDGLPGSL